MSASEQNELVVEAGLAVGKRAPLRTGETITVGRGKQATLQIVDKALSRAHFNITMNDGRCVLEDLGSLNGTYVNGQRIAGPYELRHRDIIQIATHQFSVMLAGATLAPLSLQDETLEQTAVDLHQGSDRLFCSSCDELIDPRLAGDVALDEKGQPLCAICAYLDRTEGARDFQSLLQEEAVAPVTPVPGESVDGLRRVGPFVLHDQIGSGGSGVVHKALDSRTKKWVALKLLHPQEVTPEILQRFLKEARIIASLKHPGIVRCMDIGHTDVLLYMALELIEGIDLERLLEQQGPQPERTMLLWAAQVCTALEYAHQKKVVHRDLTLKNVIKTGTQISIIDFGLSRAIGESNITLTSAGQLLGTPLYMSPEQIHDPSKVDLRCDVYALGVILYRLATGGYPYPHDKGLLTLFRTKLEEQPQPIRALRPELTAGFEALVAKAMAHDRSHRYRSAQAMADDLRELLRQQA